MRPLVPQSRIDALTAETGMGGVQAYFSLRAFASLQSRDGRRRPPLRPSAEAGERFA